MTSVMPSAASGPTDQDKKSYRTPDQQWIISTQTSPILKADPIDALHARLGIPIPEMIFGDNHVTITHVPSGWSLSFNAEDALDMVSKTEEGMLSVAYSEEWKRDREHHDNGIKEVVRPFDWSYSTAYKGTTSTATIASKPDQPDSSSTWQLSNAASHPIRTDLLSRPDPIVFYDEVVLYEDELADNGIAVLSAKIRVMPDRLLLLSRFYLRLDRVIVRLRDTRVYVELKDKHPVVVRQYTAREESYDSLRTKLASTRDDVPEALRDPVRVSGLMTVVEDTIDVCRPGDTRNTPTVLPFSTTRPAPAAATGR